jgi:hypothetical protein
VLGLKPCTIIVAALGALSAARAADLRCDTARIAQLVIPDTFAQNPSAKNLGLEVTAVTMLSVDESGGAPVCLVSVKTNQGISLKYRFRFTPEGVASWSIRPAR